MCTELISFIGALPTNGYIEPRSGGVPAGGPTPLMHCHGDKFPMRSCQVMAEPPLGTDAVSVHERGAEKRWRV